MTDSIRRTKPLEKCFYFSECNKLKIWHGMASLCDIYGLIKVINIGESSVLLPWSKAATD